MARCTIGELLATVELRDFVPKDVRNSHYKFASESGNEYKRIILPILDSLRTLIVIENLTRSPLVPVWQSMTIDITKLGDKICSWRREQNSDSQVTRIREQTVAALPQLDIAFDFSSSMAPHSFSPWTISYQVLQAQVIKHRWFHSRPSISSPQMLYK